MENIRNIFDRTRLCEGLRIPGTVALLVSNNSDFGKDLEKEIFKFLMRSGVQTIFTSNTATGIHYHDVNPFIKEFAYSTSSSQRQSYKTYIHNERPEVFIWVDPIVDAGVYNDIESSFQYMPDYKVLNIYCGKNSYGFFYGSPTAPSNEVFNKFKVPRFDHWGTSFANGHGQGGEHLFMFALLAVYLTVSEKIFDMASEKEGKGFILSNGENFDEII